MHCHVLNTFFGNYTTQLYDLSQTFVGHCFSQERVSSSHAEYKERLFSGLFLGSFFKKESTFLSSETVFALNWKTVMCA